MCTVGLSMSLIPSDLVGELRCGVACSRMHDHQGAETALRCLHYKRVVSVLAKQTLLVLCGSVWLDCHVRRVPFQKHTTRPSPRLDMNSGKRCDCVKAPPHPLRTAFPFLSPEQNTYKWCVR